jgi:adenylate cyclase class 2
VADGSNIENEVKIPYPQGADAARRLIEGRGYPQSAARTLESDQLFDREDGELQKSQQLLRLRQSGGTATVTYKGPPQGERHKRREEIEYEVSDPNAFVKVLERLGYHPGFRYEKYRTKFAAPGEPGIITIDETPIGVFLELEGEADWLDQTASKLGLPKSEYLTQSYGWLYYEHRRTHPSAGLNMVFENSRT